MSTSTERDRIVSALDNLGRDGEMPWRQHSKHEYSHACPLCSKDPQEIAAALVADGWVLRRADTTTHGSRLRGGARNG